MFGTRWRLFRLLGIPIAVDASWLVILVLMTMSYASLFPRQLEQMFPEVHQTLPAYKTWIMGLVTTLMFFACIVLHELGHAVVARARGMRIRGITLFLFGGVAEITDEPPSALTEFLMAIGGPVVSLVLGAVFLLLAWAGITFGWPSAVILVLGTLGFINFSVLVFNLVPGFPLDGGRIFRSILWGISGNLRQATYWATLVGQVFSWLLIAWGIMVVFSGPGNWVGGLFLVLIGMFLNNAARSSYQQVLIREVLKGEAVQRFMNAVPISVPPSLDLRRWVDEYVYRYHRKLFPVVDEGRLVGTIGVRALQDLPQEEWQHHTVGELMRRDLRPLTVRPQADALAALGQMQRTGLSRLLVSEGDHLIGIIALKDLLQFLNLKLQLEAEAGQDRDEPPLPPRDGHAATGPSKETTHPSKP
jgi:Zn-dependent protease/CBS domain-containing protein